MIVYIIFSKESLNEILVKYIWKFASKKCSDVLIIYMLSSCTRIKTL